MDNSKKYIEMCEKVVEIQRLWKPRAGDVCSPRFSNDATWIVRFNTGFSELKEKDIIWLPRQDQLQQMTKDLSPLLKLETFLDFCFRIYDKYSIQRNDYANEFSESMEQLWLIFVMEEKYKKVWAEEDWRE